MHLNEYYFALMIVDAFIILIHDEIAISVYMDPSVCMYVMKCIILHNDFFRYAISEFICPSLVNRLGIPLKVNPGRCIAHINSALPAMCEFHYKYKTYLRYDMTVLQFI